MAQQLQVPNAPAIPVAEREYSERQLQQAFGALSLYFRKISLLLQALTGQGGGAYLSTPSVCAPLRSALYSPFAGISAVLLSAPVAAGGATASGGDFVAPASGLYRLQFSVRLYNAAGATRDATLQLGTANPVYVAVPPLTAVVASGEQVVPLAAGDRVSLRVHQSTTDIALSDYSTPLGDSLAGSASMTFVSARP